MWKDAGKKQQAAAALKYTSFDVKRLGCVDDVIAEPKGGTQNDFPQAMQMLDERLSVHYAEIRLMPVDDLLTRRYEKFRNIAQFYTTN